MTGTQHNVVRLNTATRKVYMAGPIFAPESDEVKPLVATWREEIFGPHAVDEISSSTDKITWGRKGRFHYAGPTVLLYHGCETDTVAVDCLNEVEAADVLFIYINEQDTVGTLVELGFAVALGKPIFIWFLTERLKHEYYFARQVSTAFAVKESPLQAWKAFLDFCERERL